MLIGMMIIYQIGYILGRLVLDYICDLSAPIYEHGRRAAREIRRYSKGSPYGWGFLINPYLQIWLEHPPPRPPLKRIHVLPEGNA